MKTNKWCVTRPIDGITINTECEFLLDANNEVMLFDTPDEAKDYLLAHGFSEDDLLFINILRFEVK